MCRTEHSISPGIMRDFERLGWLDNVFRRWDELDQEAAEVMDLPPESEAEEDPIQKVAREALEGIRSLSTQ